MPSVTMMSGNVRIFVSGRRVALITPNTSATAKNAVRPPSNVTPGTMRVATQSAAAFTSSRIRKAIETTLVYSPFTYDGWNVLSRADRSFLDALAHASAGNRGHPQREPSPRSRPGSARTLVGYVSDARRRSPGLFRTRALFRPEPLHQRSDVERQSRDGEPRVAVLGYRARRRHVPVRAARTDG